jgi:hypothetical protein
MKIAAGLLPIATLFAASAIATGVIFANDTLAGANVQMAPDGGIRLTVGALGPAAVNADSGEKESLSDAERLVLERDEEFQTRLRDALRGSDRGSPPRHHTHTPGSREPHRPAELHRPGRPLKRPR